ncbi:tetraacyldisaccharide 4'-kinase [Weeksellaceae bacterium TAE3-ERU29]|nr:tetraacyldisaccharide 4'-kinase [Weeksellaceae bacterium TAE3-ERU29]
MTWRILLAPFSFIWWIITAIRNLLYNIKVFPVKKFKKPIIVVGNLAVGGTGKTPHTLYLLDLLYKNFRVASLSRGYGRKTSGFIVANYDSSARQIGDEPMIFFNRFKNRIVVAVGENRVEAIEKLLKKFRLDAVILDDAFQHRALKAGFYILLTEYNNRYNKDYLLPMGNLRESGREANRANIIIVTKCPKDLSEKEKEEIKQELKIKKNQYLFFSTIKYHEELKHIDFDIPTDELRNYNVLLVTGIANAGSLEKYVKAESKSVQYLKYPDHYNFKPNDVAAIAKAFESLSEPKLILTTEKDYMKLRHEHRIVENLYYLPISIEVDQSEKFNNIIQNYVHKVSRSS